MRLTHGPEHPLSNDDALARIVGRHGCMGRNDGARATPGIASRGAATLAGRESKGESEAPAILEIAPVGNLEPTTGSSRQPSRKRIAASERRADTSTLSRLRPRRCSGAGGAALPATSTRQGTCTQSAALATSPALSPVTKVGAWGIGDRGTHLADVRSLDMPCSRPTSYRCLDENLGAVTGLDPLGAARTRAAGHLAANYSASTSAAAKREIPSAISTHRASAYRRRARWIRYGCLSVSTQASIAVRTQTALIASIFDSRR